MSGPGRRATLLVVLALAGSFVGERVDAARHRLAALPQARYSSLTGVGVGARFTASTTETTSGVSTRIRAAAMVTEMDQYTARLDATAADARSDVSLRMVLEFRTLPEWFYGVGPTSPVDGREAFEPHRSRFHTTLTTSTWSPLTIGLRYEFENIELESLPPDGRLHASGLSGLDGAHVSGIGAILGWDTRDDRDQPTRGTLHRLYVVRFDRAFSSSHDFDVTIVDLRRYLAIDPHRVLAGQVFVYRVNGDVPFTRLASLGGRAHSRGYRRGRQLDDALLAAQLEVRWTAHRNAVCVAFAGLAQVADSVDDLRVDRVKPTLGLGVRSKPRYVPAAARFDVAAGNEGIRFYVGFGHAF